MPHRFTFRASYGREFFAGYESRVTAYYMVKQGQPQSYVMGSDDLEGDGFFGRHLLYVPEGADDPNVVFADGFDQEAFFAWAEQHDLGSGFASRNGQHASWSRRLDVRFDQQIPGFFDGVKGNVYVKVYNFLNLLNDEWGHQYDAEFFSVQVVDSSVDDAGRYVYEEFYGGSITDLLEQSSLWEARLGVEFSF